MNLIARIHIVTTALLTVAVAALLGVVMFGTSPIHSEAQRTAIQTAAADSPLLRDAIAVSLVRGEAQTVAAEISAIHHDTGQVPHIALNEDHAQIGDTQGRLWRGSHLTDYVATDTGFCFVVVKGDAWAAWDSTAPIALLGSGTGNAPAHGFCEARFAD